MLKRGFIVSETNHTHEVLKAARGFVARGWTQGPAAVDRFGCDIDVAHRDACKWCLWGAIKLSMEDVPKFQYGEAILETMDIVRDVILELHGDPHRLYNNLRHPSNYVVWFNECTGRTQEEVLEVLDTAIALTED